MADEVFPILTQAGREALVNSQATGIAVEFTHVAFGDAQWIPDSSAQALRNKLREVSISSIEKIEDSNAVFNISVRLDDTPEGPNRFKIGEIGILGKSDGVGESVLFAILSRQGEFFSEKFEGETFVFSFNFILDDAKGAEIKVASPELNLNLSLVDQVAHWAKIITDIHTKQIDMLERLTRLEQERR